MASARHEIDFVQITAGKWKRTVDPFAEITPEAREKAKEDGAAVGGSDLGGLGGGEDDRITLEDWDMMTL